jgi:hypothetical protein
MNERTGRTEYVDVEGWTDPKASAIIDLLPTRLGRYEMIENAGHYPYARYPRRGAGAILPFLAEHNHA